ncbi:MAG TPA: tripartite tricarboxylate transporter substrate-binding protein [Candidatus Udaeobacter sp.]|jgi:tripartite-type tricarboxylate transporter receptor subunit TctC|nr:tripartite tricarboxylate transporter substrate-binding protein [Candidatus Udaeobacter sp.]
MKEMKKFVAFLFAALMLGSHGDIKAQEQPFYRGQSIKIVVGFTTGGFYDRWSRLLARHVPKYIPGNPEMIVQNMPGAGGLVAANHVYSVAKPDGLTLGMLSYGIYLDQLVGRKEVQYDVRKFNWIGSPEKSDVLLYMRSDAPYKSLEDIRKASTPPKCGSTGTAGTDYILARMLEDTLGLKITTVLGYPGGSEIDLAVEKGEVQCRGMTAAPFFGREPFITWRKNNFVRVLLFGGQKRDERIPEAPTIYEIFDKEKTAEENRRVADVILRGGDFGRPWIAPPGTPKERVKLLRDAHAKAMADPALLAEAKKGQMEVGVMSGEELQQLAETIMNQPPRVIERVKKVLGQ